MLTKDGPYQRNSRGGYNPTFVSKLLKSFRSHPAILEVPNMCFYEEELRACADPLKREMFCNWEVCETYTSSNSA